MYNDVKRDAAYIKRLTGLIEAQYGIYARSIAPATRGYYGETWRLDADASAYFVKLDYMPRHRRLFEHSLPVVNYLYSRGIDFISRVAPTRSGTLCVEFEGAALGMFDWIEGHNLETDDTKAAEYALLSRIYPLTRPGFDIPRVDYSDASARLCYRLWDELRASTGEASQLARGLLERNAALLERCARRLCTMADRARALDRPLYLTHGDAGGNFYVCGERNYILDWDEVMYAPLERDAWVMCCRDWARRLFEDTMRAAGIDCTLEPAVLAFYCYHMFFFYLSEFLADTLRFEDAESLRQYLTDSWIFERIAYADSVS